VPRDDAVLLELAQGRGRHFFDKPGRLPPPP
jgi:hypothetical protein